MPAACGEAEVESKQGDIEVGVDFRNLQSATRFGPEFLTYVLWTITPEGRASNLGEVILNGASSSSTSRPTCRHSALWSLQNVFWRPAAQRCRCDGELRQSRRRWQSCKRRRRLIAHKPSDGFLAHPHVRQKSHGLSRRVYLLLSQPGSVLYRLLNIFAF